MKITSFITIQYNQLELEISFKSKVKYSGKQLAIITGLKTLMTLSYS